jgi:hypothetical protein
MNSHLDIKRRKFIQRTSAVGLGIGWLGVTPAHAEKYKYGDSLNHIEIENKKLGTQDWSLINPATNNEISGYASKTSLTYGDSINFFVDTAESSFSINIYRLGWYNGAGGRQMQNTVVLHGKKQAPYTINAHNGMVECNWATSYQLTLAHDGATAANWPSGVYLVKLTANDSKKQSYIHFVVRSDQREIDHLFQCSVTTYQAYNTWGGKSLYAFNSTNNVASTSVSFNRPYDKNGAGQFFEYEYAMLRFLEREGYEVSYCTNLDVHDNPQQIYSHKNFISTGHDEYWSWNMRAHVEQARDRGVNISFFSANTCYWQIRMEPSPISHTPNRTMVCYKNAAIDPVAVQRQYQHLTTVRWREAPVNRPENTLLGVMFDHYPVQNQPIVISNSSHWVFDGTGLRNGAALPGLLGYEADRIFPGGPANLVTLATSPVPGSALPSHMTIYQTAYRSSVFAAGTIQWSWGLDNYNEFARGVKVSPAAQQITRNVLNAFERGS